MMGNPQVTSTMAPNAINSRKQQKTGCKAKPCERDEFELHDHIFLFNNPYTKSIKASRTVSRQRKKGHRAKAAKWVNKIRIKLGVDVSPDMVPAQRPGAKNGPPAPCRYRCSSRNSLLPGESFPCPANRHSISRTDSPSNMRKNLFGIRDQKEKDGTTCLTP